MASVLEVEGLRAGYGEAVVLEDIAFTLERGASLAILGRNGVGKSTLVDTLMGLTRLRAGRIGLHGLSIEKLPPHARAARGLGWVPQERFVFPSLTVDEHLQVVARPGPWTASRVFELFPALAERRGNLGSRLSGGEQQMLAIGRALMLNPAVLLLDEPMEGLAPLVVKDMAATIRSLIAEGAMAVVLVEQHARLALQLTSKALVLDRGRISHRAASAGLLADPDALGRLVSVA
jgi:branched-chain amino acid transport system ATP-binding protein